MVRLHHARRCYIGFLRGKKKTLMVVASAGQSMLQYQPTGQDMPIGAIEALLL